ncbi:MAG: 2-oxoglutarate ferredoxin oxidoreductase subunit beta [Candidatus Poribacteria bacterium]|nr:MAG: 2-oxoglutarate ferredoxin oxidoreductase subunit beta [Candidatus Poribacteria bacterium]
MAQQATPKAVPTYTREDFQSDQLVRWCPGCGDYAILAQVQRTLPEMGVRRENVVFVSGIGCSSRFPYYMNTYGFHGIHGRAPAIATGLKLARPELDVWVITGDGDGLSIGTNHTLQICRRNVNVTLLLFNNQIYGLTKGQYSPTSPHGQRTYSSPYGNLDWPFNPIRVALGANAAFIARTIDRDQKHLAEVLLRAHEHRGTSFVEIYQNCIVFNDGAFEDLVDKATRDDHVLYLEHGKPMVFGKNRDKGIRLDGLQPQVVSLSDGRWSVSDLLVHDEKEPSGALAEILASFQERPGFPRPVGVFRDIERPIYEEEIHRLVEQASASTTDQDLMELLEGGETWIVKEEEEPAPVQA